MAVILDRAIRRWGSNHGGNFGWRMAEGGEVKGDDVGWRGDEPVTLVVRFGVDTGGKESEEVER